MGPRRIAHLDGLRGLAALMVVIAHVAEVANRLVPTLWLETTLAWVGLGRVGVVAFFCISGFVIPFSFRPIAPARNFMISRFFRLYPAFWLSLALAVVWAGEMAWPALLANATMAPILFGQPDAISVYWTLFIELIFYVVSLGLFMAGFLHQTWAAIASAAFFWSVSIMAAMAFYLDAPIQPPAGILGYLGMMFLGTVWRRSWLDGEPVARKAMSWMIIAAILTIATVGLVGYGPENWPERPLADFLGTFGGLALFFGAFAIKDFLARPVMIFLGNVSYSLYLLHPVVVAACAAWAGRASDPEVAIGILLMSVPFSIALSFLAYRLVELPAIEWGKRLSQTVSKQSAPRGAV